MRLLKYIVVIVLLIVPIFSIYYKVNIQKTSFIPYKATNEWNLELTYNLKKLGQEEDELLVPIISPSYNQKIISENLSQEVQLQNIESGKLIKLDFNNVNFLTQTTHLEIEKRETQDRIKSSLRTHEPAIHKKYTDTSALSLSVKDSLKTIMSNFVFKTDSKDDIIKKIYFFISEEIVKSDKIEDIESVISLLEGSDQAKASLMMYMLRLKNIPARVNVILEVNKDKSTDYKAKMSFLTEAIIDNVWQPVGLNDRNYRSLKSNQIVLFKDLLFLDVEKVFKALSFKVSPVFKNEMDSVLYKESLQKMSRFYSMLSFHNLPLTMQYILLTLLLIPFGTVILSFGRNIVGVKTFGIFTPILLTLFFIETSLLTGLVFFTIVVGLGFAQRYVLDRFHLLAVPRLSILLTLVIISYCIMSLFLYQNETFVQEQALSYFPIVIITVFIEKFSVYFIEEGLKNTMKALMGTLFVSILCYIAFKLEFIKLAVFNHPEILLIFIALNILIGSYKGYRLSELLRFKEFKRLEE